MAVCSKCGNYYSSTTCIYCKEESVSANSSAAVSTNADTMSAENYGANTREDIAPIVVMPEHIADDYTAPPIKLAASTKPTPLTAPTTTIAQQETVEVAEIAETTSQPAFKTIATKTSVSVKAATVGIIIFSILALILLFCGVLFINVAGSVKFWFMFIALFIVVIASLYSTLQYRKAPKILVETDGQSLRFYSASEQHTYPLSEIMYVEFEPDRHKHRDLHTGCLTIAVETNLYDIKFVDNVATVHAALLEMLQLTYNYDIQC